MLSATATDMEHGMSRLYLTRQENAAASKMLGQMRN